MHVARVVAGDHLDVSRAAPSSWNVSGADTASASTASLGSVRRVFSAAQAHVLGNDRGPNRAYRQLGNAVCPPPVAAVARALLTSLGVVLGVRRPEEAAGDGDEAVV